MLTIHFVYLLCFAISLVCSHLLFYQFLSGCGNFARCNYNALSRCQEAENAENVVYSGIFFPLTNKAIVKFLLPVGLI